MAAVEAHKAIGMEGYKDIGGGFAGSLSGELRNGLDGLRLCWLQYPILDTPAMVRRALSR